VWRVKIEEDKEFFAYPVQRDDLIQGDVTIEGVSDTNKMDSKLMPRETTIQWLFPMLHPNNPILKMCKRFVHIDQ
jgi:hypothetical protein